MQRFESSVVSYPQRGRGGDPRWRGNSGPKIIEQFLLTWHTDQHGNLDTKNLVVDPAMGGDCTGSVCRELGVPYRGFDLYQGFDAVRDDLLSKLDGRHARSVFFHPPYLGLLPYSGAVWGKAPHPADLSHVGTDEATFDELLQGILQNIARATQPGGHYAVLVGNWRKNGRFYHMSSHVVTLAPDPIIDEVIKIQHGVASDNRTYHGNVVRIMHEQLLVFRRADDPSIFAMSYATLDRLNAFVRMTWRNIIVGAMRSGEATTAKELVERLETHPRASNTNSLHAKVRQELRLHPEIFERVARGKYTLAAHEHAGFSPRV
jgi:hypothetical protein